MRKPQLPAPNTEGQGAGVASNTAPKRKKKLWERLSISSLESWPLTSRLIAIIASQVILATLISGTINVISLRDTMQQQLDEQLNSAVTLVTRKLETGAVDPGTGFLEIPGLPTWTMGVIIYDGQPLQAQMITTVGSSVTLSRETLDVLVSLENHTAPTTVTLADGLGGYRMGIKKLSNDATLLVGLPISDMNKTLGRQQAYVVFIAVIISALSALLALILVRWNMRPLRRVAEAANTISQMKLDKGEVDLQIRLQESELEPSTEVGQVGYAFKLMLDNIRRALIARQESEQQVRDFVADASHELRTPLAAIRGYAELTRLQDPNLNEDVQQSIDRISSEALRMTNLVEEMLLLASLDANRPLEKELVELGPVLSDAFGDAQTIGTDHTWKFEQTSEQIQIIADPVKIHQMVANLLANARVHTPSGSTVTLRLLKEHELSSHENVENASISDVPSATEDEIGDPIAVIEVEDNGPGISAEFQQKMFQRFARGDSSRSRRTGSTGLGLSIVHAIAGAHDGVVELTSVPGRTVFRISVPAVTLGDD